MTEFLSLFFFIVVVLSQKTICLFVLFVPLETKTHIITTTTTTTTTSDNRPKETHKCSSWRQSEFPQPTHTHTPYLHEITWHFFFGSMFVPNKQTNKQRERERERKNVESQSLIFDKK